MEKYSMLLTATMFAILGTALADDGAWSVPSWIPIVAGATVIVLVFALCMFWDKKSDYNGAHDEKDNIRKRQDNTEPCNDSQR